MKETLRHRLNRLITESISIADEADLLTQETHEVMGVVTLFSGGHDSTVLAHMFREYATHLAHANTGIGIEQTRQFVRDCAKQWGLPLLERHPEPGYGYRDLILGQCRAKTGPNKGTVLWPGGFPGPGAHFMMYQRLKERALNQVRNELVRNPRRERVIFLAGRRAEESGRRRGLALKSPIERRGSVVWVSPLVNWTKLDLNEYRRAYPDVPRNEVSDLLHMSGECLCGSFAHPGELDEIGEWFPEVKTEIQHLEHEVQALDLDINPERCKWGWGTNKERPSKIGDLCSSCDTRFKENMG